MAEGYMNIPEKETFGFFDELGQRTKFCGGLHHVMPEIIALCADRSNYEPVAESTGMIRKPLKPAGRKETADRKNIFLK